VNSGLFGAYIKDKHKNEGNENDSSEVFKNKKFSELDDKFLMAGL
jgi:hypothetical protein